VPDHTTVGKGAKHVALAALLDGGCCVSDRRAIASVGQRSSFAAATIGHTFVWAAPDGLKAVTQ